jgi:hypothetical protein
VRSEESEVSSENFSRETCVFSKNAGMLYLKANANTVHIRGVQETPSQFVPGWPPHPALRATLSPKGARVVNSN